MTTYREAFDNMLQKIDRYGVSELVEWLEKETDFFEAPSSSSFHGNYEGGLLEHTIHVLQFALGNFNYLLKKKPELEYLKESVIIAALFHDVCKVNTYKRGERFTKNKDNKWVTYIGWEFDDKFPFGHGEKSVYYISKFVQLTDPEALAIRWHMGRFEPGTNLNDVTKWTFDRAWEHPLVKLIHVSDVLAGSVDGFIDYKGQAQNKS